MTQCRKTVLDYHNAKPGERHGHFTKRQCKNAARKDSSYCLIHSTKFHGVEDWQGSPEPVGSEHNPDHYSMFND